MSIIKCVKEEDVRLIKEYLGSDVLKVPYLYTNLYEYGVGNANVDLWFDVSEKQIRGVYLRYFTTMHFYTKDKEYPHNVFLNFVEKINPEVIIVEEIFGLSIQPILKADALSRLYIVQLTVKNPEYSNKVEFAKKEDFQEISELLMKDPLYQKIYTQESLYLQLLERFEAGYGRCCIIRQDDKIVTSYSFNGENDLFAIVGGLMVHPDYRRLGLGFITIKHLFRYFNDKELLVISFIEDDNTASLEMHKSDSTSLGMIYKFLKK